MKGPKSLCRHCLASPPSIFPRWHALATLWLHDILMAGKYSVPTTQSLLPPPSSSIHKTSRAEQNLRAASSSQCPRVRVYPAQRLSFNPSNEHASSKSKGCKCTSGCQSWIALWWFQVQQNMLSSCGLCCIIVIGHVCAASLSVVFFNASIISQAAPRQLSCRACTQCLVVPCSNVRCQKPPLHM